MTAANSEECHAFYCPHAYAFFYTVVFVSHVLDTFNSSYISVSSGVKHVQLLGCVFVCGELVSSRHYDMIDVCAGGLVGVTSGKWAIKNLYGVIVSGKRNEVENNENADIIDNEGADCEDASIL